MTSVLTIRGKPLKEITKCIECIPHSNVFTMYSFCVLQGSEGFESQINRCLDNAEYLYDKLKGRPDFQLVFKSKVSHVRSTATASVSSKV